MATTFISQKEYLRYSDNIDYRDDLSIDEKKVLDDIILFDKKYNGKSSVGSENYGTGLYYQGDSSAYALRLSTVTESDLKEYLDFRLNPQDLNGIKNLVKHARELSLKGHDLLIDKDVVLGYFNKDGSVKNVANLKTAVNNFDKFDNPNDNLVFHVDLDAFAETYGLNADQKSSLKLLYPQNWIAFDF